MDPVEAREANNLQLYKCPSCGGNVGAANDNTLRDHTIHFNVHGNISPELLASLSAPCPGSGTPLPMRRKN